MEEKKRRAKVPRRPNRLLLVLMCLLLALVIGVTAFVANVASPYFGMLNLILSGAPQGAETDAVREQTAAMTEQVEAEAAILLKNEGALPLAADAKVNVFGAGQINFAFGGTGSGAGDESANVGFIDGLRNAGLQPNEELAQFYDQNVQRREKIAMVGTDWGIYELPASCYDQELIDSAKAYSDVAVVLISRMGGEGADLPMDMEGYAGGEAGKHYLELTSDEQAMLEMVEQNFGNVIVVLNAANPMELGFVESEGVDAALWMGFPGTRGMNAVGDVLVGAINPSGRTVDTFAYAVESAPSYYSFGDYDYSNATYKNTSLFAGTGTASTGDDNLHYVDYIEGIYVGYRYYETAAADGFINYDETVQYPFGYGLSYTTFEKSIADCRDDGETISVDVSVTNSGGVAGKDVVQVYYSAPYTPGGIEKSAVVLGGFAKTKLLEPGETQTLTIEFSREDMASYDCGGVKAAGGAYVLEAGDYVVSLRENSHDVIDEHIVTVERDHIYNDANDGARTTDAVAATNRFDDVSVDEGIAYVSRADWAGTMPTERAAQSREATEKQIADFEGEPLEAGEGEDIAFASNGLKLADMKGLDYDDPQWERLLEQLSVDDMKTLVANGGWMTVAVDSVGKPHLSEIDGPAGVNNIMAGIQGTQLTAQSMLGYSWNVELARQMGEVFGAEARAYGTSGLYAPGANIHRSPFSGRNFEYISEDGLLTGKIVAAEVQGIQSQGLYCYTKHFAVNDQETNRDQGGLATWLSEQAMREIYLRGFELAVKEGGSKGMMSSFNRIGATPAAESWELLTGVLRQEWGFRGAVVTDCVMACSTQDPDRALRAGNDLQLSFFSDITADTTDTVAGRQALRQASHNILYMVANSDALEIADWGPYPFVVALIVADAVIIALFALYFWRRHVGMVRWREAGRPKGWLARKLSRSDS
ncbi:glycoside hydrolase family 3 C-terminal domain-containing protein [Thermophilibacter provencensis]|uniref:glycoside hydrolase family 3 protein n=1 Tax=Thermophilibacter provencensis TaxID=1852386 RepID=UPI002943227B|nr:glycoside hydrolase family 3 N-terminal domain-containing protein [Thermophilibacter provencensis]